MPGPIAPKFRVPTTAEDGSGRVWEGWSLSLLNADRICSSWAAGPAADGATRRAEAELEAATPAAPGAGSMPSPSCCCSEWAQSVCVRPKHGGWKHKALALSSLYWSLFADLRHSSGLGHLSCRVGRAARPKQGFLGAW